MCKGRELIGLPVINQQTGQEVGKAEELYLQLEEAKIAGLRVRCGNWLTSSENVPLESIVQVSKEAIYINPGVEEKGPQGKTEEACSAFATCEVKELKGLPVVSAEGEALGTIEDVLFELPEGRISGWELSGGIVQDLVDGRKFLPGASVLYYSPEQFVVQEGGWQG